MDDITTKNTEVFLKRLCWRNSIAPTAKYSIRYAIRPVCALRCGGTDAWLVRWRASFSFSSRQDAMGCGMCAKIDRWTPGNINPTRAQTTPLELRLSQFQTTPIPIISANRCEMSPDNHTGYLKDQLTWFPVDFQEFPGDISTII